LAFGGRVLWKTSARKVTKNKYEQHILSHYPSTQPELVSAFERRQIIQKLARNRLVQYNLRFTVIAMIDFASACLNGRSSCRSTARIYAALPRGNFCERWGQSSDGSAVGLSYVPPINLRGLIQWPSFNF
jgi:hypothetical protein